MAGWVGGGRPDSWNLWGACQRGRPGPGRLQGLGLSGLVKGFMEVSSRKLDKPQAPHLQRFCRVSQVLGCEGLLPSAGRRRADSREEGREGLPSRQQTATPCLIRARGSREGVVLALGQSWGVGAVPGLGQAPAAWTPPAWPRPCSSTEWCG